MTVRIGGVTVCAVAALAGAGCGGSGGAGEGSEPVAHVGGAAITREQLDSTLEHFQEEAKNEGRPFPKSGSPRYRAVQRQLLALLVYRAELAGAARKLGITVTDEEVKKRLEAASPGGEEEKGRFTEDTVRAEILYEDVYRKVTTGVPPSRRADAVRRWLAEMKRDYAGKVSYEPGYAPGS